MSDVALSGGPTKALVSWVAEGSRGSEAATRNGKLVAIKLEKTLFCSAKYRNSSEENAYWLSPCRLFANHRSRRTIRPELRTGTGLRATVLTTLISVVFISMRTPNLTTATKVKLGLFASI